MLQILNVCAFFYFGLGVDGYDGDGDITKPENVEAFKSYVLSCTEGRGVHFVMADGVSTRTLLGAGYIPYKFSFKISYQTFLQWPKGDQCPSNEVHSDRH